MFQMRYCLVYFSLVLSLSCDLALATTCKGSATYKFTFQAAWTAQSHPEDFPASNNPHFSSVVGCSHNSDYVMWRPGKLASQGVKLVAESGSPGTMNGEIDAQITTKKASSRFNSGGPSNTGTSTTSDVQVNTKYPLVSAISMIAPSPDWFVGVRDFSLCNETTGTWVDKREHALALYDAGTDSAPRFVHNNSPANPPKPIFRITNTHEGSLKSNNTIKPFGMFTFEKISEDVGNTSTTPSNSATQQLTGHHHLATVVTLTLSIMFATFYFM